MPRARGGSSRSIADSHERSLSLSHVPIHSHPFTHTHAPSYTHSPTSSQPRIHWIDFAHSYVNHVVDDAVGDDAGGMDDGGVRGEQGEPNEPNEAEEPEVMETAERLPPDGEEQPDGEDSDEDGVLQGLENLLAIWREVERRVMMMMMMMME